MEAAAPYAKDDPSGNFKPPFKDQLLDLGAARLADMDAAGIDVQVLSLPGSGLDKLDADRATALARGANDLAAATVEAYPDRFAAFASLTLQDPAAAAGELRRCVERFGIQGRDGTRHDGRPVPGPPALHARLRGGLRR